MSVRRVRVDDDEAVAYAADPESIEDSEDEAQFEAWLDLEYEEEQREMTEAAAESERAERAELRSQDLRAVPTAPPPPAPRPLTEEQASRLPDWTITLAGELLDATTDEEGRLQIHEDGSQKERFRHELEGEAPFRWLRENDPLSTSEGVRAELQKLAGYHGMTLADLQSAFRAGRPSRAQQAHRERVRGVLTEPWVDERRRTLLAEALGCSRPALYKLMRD